MFDSVDLMFATVLLLKWTGIRLNILDDKNVLDCKWEEYVLSHLDEIEKAVIYANKGNFYKSIEIYLDIIERERKFHPEILVMLYPSVLCSGMLSFAYEVIVWAELFIKKRYGHFNPSGEQWEAEIFRKGFEGVLQISCDVCPQLSMISSPEQVAHRDERLRKEVWMSHMMNFYREGVKDNQHMYVSNEIESEVESCIDYYNDLRKKGLIKD